MRPPSRSLNEYLEARLAPAPTGCWLWTGRINGSGYGEVILRRRYAGPAHRLMYELMVCEIPNGLVLDHLCRVRNCVNPEHLEPVTVAINNRRAADVKQTCSKGHPYSGKNSEGYRICRTCQLVNERRSRARKRAA